MRCLDFRSVLLALLCFALLGCESTGLTERRWNRGYAALAPGLEPADVLISIGNPRDIVPADPSSGTPETWIYSRPERVGRTITQTGENDIPLPHGNGTVTVPVYEDQDVIKRVEYHLTWTDQRLQSWARIVTR